MSSTAPKRCQKRRSPEKALCKASKKREELTAPTEPRPKNLPLWVPHGIDLRVVPEEVQNAAAELVQPLYDQFVINASDCMEKSLGVTITHLLWLEILEQFDLKREYTQIQAVLDIPGNRQDMIDRHLRLIDSKLRVGYFLIRIRELAKRRSRRSHAPKQFAPKPNPRHSPFRKQCQCNTSPSAADAAIDGIGDRKPMIINQFCKYLRLFNLQFAFCNYQFAINCTPVNAHISLENTLIPSLPSCP